ncbi:MAG: hypothetical protein LBC86_05760 [Oscillospiraceae bacterium]|jgi:hypothetical protein|nr:hypothetical protein [Oscillospiraceae bacterium]
MNNIKDERHFCLETLESAREILLSAVEMLPKLRAGYDKHKGSEKEDDFDFLNTQAQELAIRSGIFQQGTLLAA